MTIARIYTTYTTESLIYMYILIASADQLMANRSCVEFIMFSMNAILIQSYFPLNSIDG